MKNLLVGRASLRGLLLITVILVAFYLSISVSVSSAQQATQPLAVNLNELNWGPPGGGNGTPLGLRTSRQGVDPVTGGQTYYAMFPAGTHVVVVKGEVTIELGDEAYDLSAGSYIVIPGKLNHSWDVPEGGSEAIILVRRAGPADFHFVVN